MEKDINIYEYLNDDDIKIKSHDNYNYNDILDYYNLTKNKKFISYCFIKKNNLSLVDIIDIFREYENDIDFEKIYLFVLNIQRELDGKIPIKKIEFSVSNLE